MKHDKNWGRKLTLASIGLIVVSCLLMYVSFTLERLGLGETLYCVVMVALALMEVAMVYALVRTFFGRGKK